MFGNPVPYYIKQLIGIMDNPGVLQRLARMNAGYGKRRGNGYYIHTGGYPGSYAVGRVLKHKTLLRRNVQFLGC